jgi:hypothetical protein
MMMSVDRFALALSMLDRTVACVAQDSPQPANAVLVPAYLPHSTALKR